MTTLAVEDLKRVHRAIWSAGDYAAISDAITDELVPDQLLARVGIEPGHEVLDVATGTGNVALRAAATARAVGLDLTPELLEIARSRADAHGVDVEWVEGDAEDLPFESGRFDRVLSAFGVQFAPRHEVVAAELARVCKPGGTIGLASWTPEGAIGNMLAIIGRYSPPPPPYVSPPARWGSEEHVERLFAGEPVELQFERATKPLRFDSAEHFISFMEACYGPMVKARERLTGEGRWDDCRAELVDVFEARNESSNGRLQVDAEYLLAIAHKLD
ncbi:MAG TPA: class I SAM-dependent methyltransferase [Gaiellaceae bacterium]